MREEEAKNIKIDIDKLRKVFNANSWKAYVSIEGVFEIIDNHIGDKDNANT